MDRKRKGIMKCDECGDRGHGCFGSGRNDGYGYNHCVIPTITTIEDYIQHGIDYLMTARLNNKHPVTDTILKNTIKTLNGHLRVRKKAK